MSGSDHLPFTHRAEAALALEARTALDPDTAMQVVLTVAERFQGEDWFPLLNDGFSSARVAVTRKIDERTLQLMIVGKRGIAGLGGNPYGVFPAWARPGGDRTALRVGGLEAYTTVQSKAFLFVPVGLKSIPALGEYRRFLDQIAAVVRELDPSASLSTGRLPVVVPSGSTSPPTSNEPGGAGPRDELRPAAPAASAPGPPPAEASEAKTAAAPAAFPPLIPLSRQIQPPPVSVPSRVTGPAPAPPLPGPRPPGAAAASGQPSKRSGSSKAFLFALLGLGLLVVVVLGTLGARFWLDGGGVPEGAVSPQSGVAPAPPAPQTGQATPQGGPVAAPTPTPAPMPTPTPTPAPTPAGQPFSTDTFSLVVPPGLQVTSQSTDRLTMYEGQADSGVVVQAQSVSNALSAADLQQQTLSSMQSNYGTVGTCVAQRDVTVGAVDGILVGYLYTYTPSDGSGSFPVCDAYWFGTDSTGSARYMVQQFARQTNYAQLDPLAVSVRDSIRWTLP